MSVAVRAFVVFALLVTDVLPAAAKEAESFAFWADHGLYYRRYSQFRATDPAGPPASDPQLSQQGLHYVAQGGGFFGNTTALGNRFGADAYLSLGYRFGGESPAFPSSVPEDGLSIYGRLSLPVTLVQLPGFALGAGLGGEYGYLMGWHFGVLFSARAVLTLGGWHGRVEFDRGLGSGENVLRVVVGQEKGFRVGFQGRFREWRSPIDAAQQTYAQSSTDLGVMALLTF